MSDTVERKGVRVSECVVDCVCVCVLLWLACLQAAHNYVGCMGWSMSVFIFLRMRI